MHNTVQDKERAAREATWPKTLAEMFDVLNALFVRRGRSQADAADDAQAAVMEIAMLAGGHSIYIPMGQRIKRALRDQCIAASFNGRNYCELARQHNLAENTVRVIVERQRAREHACASNAVATPQKGEA